MKNIQIYDRILLEHPERKLAIEYVDNLICHQPSDDSDVWRLIDLETKEVIFKSVLLHDVITKASCIQRIRFANRHNSNIVAKTSQNNLEKGRYNYLLGKQCWKAPSSNTIYIGHVTSLRESNGWLEASVKWQFKGNDDVSNRKGHTNWERVASLSFENPRFENDSFNESLDCQGIEEEPNSQIRDGNGLW